MSGLTPRPALWISIALASALPLAGAAYMAPQINLSSLPPRILYHIGFRRGGHWRLLALLFALLNLKSLPFAWHIRLLRALLAHVSLLRSRCPPAPPAGSLFAPIITTTRCSLLEMDYNLHKSNSTYFSDLDVSRMHIMSCLLKRGLHRLHFKTVPPLLPDEKLGRFGIFFGGVQCSFRREVKPGQRTQIWTRVLAWDRKWLYLVSHIVEDNAPKPRGYWLQPWRKGADVQHVKATDVNGTAGKRVPDKAILATSVSKYVFKQGRITIPPELALQASDLLPPKPENLPDPSPQGSGTGTPAIGSAVGQVASAATATAELLPSLPATSASSSDMDEDYMLVPPSLSDWTWDAVEQERQRGMALARHMSALDDAVLVWSGSEGMALAEY